MEKKGTKFISKLGGILMPGSSDPSDIRGSLVVSDPAVSFSSRKCECLLSHNTALTTQHTHSLRLSPSASFSQVHYTKYRWPCYSRNLRVQTPFNTRTRDPFLSR